MLFVLYPQMLFFVLLGVLGVLCGESFLPPSGGHIIPILSGLRRLPQPTGGSMNAFDKNHILLGSF
jgi:hypothetical protein